MVSTHYIYELENLMEKFKGGKIALPEYVKEWEKLTSDPEILQITRGDVIKFIRDPPAKHQARPCLLSKENEVLIDKEIESMLAQGIIKMTTWEPDEYVSPIFPVSNPDGRVRVILNLKVLNRYVEYLHFKMDNIHTVLRCVTPNCYMASIDLKQAYYSVKIDDFFQKFLKFRWKDNLYQYTCYPNGLGPCPRKFTKIMKVPLSCLRENGHMIVGYIDDFFLQGQTYETCRTTTFTSANLFQKLGFTVHLQKSQLEPRQKVEFLGFVIDSVAMTVSLPEEKKSKILLLIDNVLQKHKLPIRDVAALVGNFVSSFPASMFGPMYYRNIEINKAKALKKYRGNYDAYMILSEDARSEICWWKQNIPTMTGPVRWPPITQEISADAAGKKGWGATYKDMRIGGTWDYDQAGLHINIKEMLAVLYALRSFVEYIRGTHVRVLSDNKTTVSDINKMGSTKSKQCNIMAQCVWEFCKDNDIYVTCTFIPGKENVEADRESRREYKQAEWMLHKTLFDRAAQHFSFTPNIDCFASRVNTQLKVYASRKPDPYATHINGFSINWGLYNAYLFPPFSVIFKVIQKLRVDQATALCVLPKWPTQAWWPHVQDMLVGEPLMIPPHPQNLVLPGKPEELHPLHKKLGLCICLLSGRPTGERVIPLKVSI